MAKRIKYGTRDKKNTRKTIFVFSVSTWDIEKELRAFNNKIGKELLGHLKQEDPGRHIQRLIEHRLSTRAPMGSGRIKRILTAMRKHKNYTKSLGGSTKMSGPGRVVTLNMINKKTMDKDTNIGRLDADFKQYHKADFAEEEDRVKKLRGPAMSYRKQVRFSLWRMFEYEFNSKNYKIPKTSSGRMKFTSSKNNYSAWYFRRSVNWKAGPKGAANSAYYILNSSRKMYKNDKGIFARSVFRGVKSILENKTRFN